MANKTVEKYQQTHLAYDAGCDGDTYMTNDTDMTNTDAKTVDVAVELYRKIRAQQLSDFLGRMPDEKQGVEMSVCGQKYVAAIRRLTPKECMRLQTVPSWYEFVTSDAQTYRSLGNGWNIETVKHCFSFIPEDRRKRMVVLSLFDGISGGQMALRELGFDVKLYLSSEIDRHAIANTQHNFPHTVQLGSVTDLDVKTIVERYGIPDLLIGGSPCQSFSFSGKMKGMSTNTGEEVYTLEKYLELKRQGFSFEGQSYLFWEYMRVLAELREYSPDIMFFLENVRMQEKWERCLSHAIGVRGVHIDSALVSAQHRRRIYWTNIRTRPVAGDTLFADANDPFSWPRLISDIPQPEDRNIAIRDILDSDVDSKYYLCDGRLRRLVEMTDPSKLSEYLLEPQVSVDDAMAYMTSHEEYCNLSEDEKCKIAEEGYKLEKERLRDIYEKEQGI